MNKINYNKQHSDLHQIPSINILTKDFSSSSSIRLLLEASPWRKKHLLFLKLIEIHQLKHFV